MRHLLRCQGHAVKTYGFALDALDLAHPRLLQQQGVVSIKPENSQTSPCFGWPVLSTKEIRNEKKRQRNHQQDRN